MESSLLLSTNLRSFELDHTNISVIDEKTTVITKWNWDYQLAHSFQKYAVERLQVHPKKRILICCSHPRLLTNGRGLQKPKKGESFDLKEFKKEDYPNLPYPLHQIERGGGLTFHNPGQFIFYPIVKLNPQTLSLSKMVDNIFDVSIEVLRNLGIDNLSHENKLLGLWHGQRKLASMGIAIDKLTTYHGMGLNLFRDEEMMKALTALNPCGLGPSTYIAADELIPATHLRHELFADAFLGRITNAWK
jgi:lipoyl(octanoyl) transferase